MAQLCECNTVTLVTVCSNQHRPFSSQKRGSIEKYGGYLPRFGPVTRGDTDDPKFDWVAAGLHSTIVAARYSTSGSIKDLHPMIQVADVPRLLSHLAYVRHHDTLLTQQVRLTN